MVSQHMRVHKELTEALEQNHALQVTNTKLALRVRKLDAALRLWLAVDKDSFAGGLKPFQWSDAVANTRKAMAEAKEGE